jgi:hypothetical protein
VEQNRARNLVTATLAALLPTPALAQQEQSPPALQVFSNTLVVQPQRIVDECRIEGAQTLCVNVPPENMRWKTVTLQIPDFKPEDRETHVYVLSDVHGYGSGGGSVSADENGLLSKQEVDRSSLPGIAADEEAAQYYFTALDVATLEARVTLDLYQVRLWPFLSSLQSAIQMGTQMATRAQFVPGVRGPRVSGDRLKYQDVRVSIQGEHMTLDEVLDAVYLDSGCIVDQQAEALVLASCP